MKYLNIDIITKIKQDPKILSGEKDVLSVIKDPNIASQLSNDDLNELESFSKSIKESLQIKEQIQDSGIRLDKIITDGIPDYLKLSREDYKKVIPIFIEWITQHRNNTYEGLIRDLSTPYAKEDSYKLFIDEFVRLPNNGKYHSYKWALGNGLNVFSGDDIIDNLLPLAVDSKYGTARQMIVLGLGKVKKAENKEKVTNVLIKLLNDEDVAGHAIEALGKLKAIKAKPYLERFLNHKKTWWRNAAKSAIKKIEKHQN